MVVRFRSVMLTFLVLALVLASSLPLPLFIPSSSVAQAADPMVEIAGSTPAEIGRAVASRQAAPVSGDNEVLLALTPRNASQLENLARAANDPKSPLYRRFLSDAQIVQQFAPDQAAVQRLKDYFTVQGLKIGYESANHLFLSIKGANAQLDQAFGTRSELRQTARGETGLINTTALRLPASLVGSVVGVTGFDRLHPFHLVSNALGMAQANASHHLYSPANIGYAAPVTTSNTPTTTRQAYNIPATGMDGTGTRIAITLWGAPSLDDLGRWVNYYGHPLSLTILPPTPAATDDSVRFEANMDVQLVQTAAPNTAIRFYVSTSNYEQPLLQVLSQAVDDNVNAISNSWTDCEPSRNGTTLSTYRSLFSLAAVKGIPVFFGSGDSGVVMCNDPNNYNVTMWGYANFPASDEFVTGVGGTLLSRDDTTYAWYNETGWSCTPNQVIGDFMCEQIVGGSSGGGLATRLPRPAYQNSVAITIEDKFTNRPATPQRALPDVSMNGDPGSGQPVFAKVPGFPPFSNGCNDDCPSGGTSASTPLLAGIALLAAQKAGGQLGNFNPFLYSHVGASWLFDNVLGYNGVNAHPGWDYVTGLGSIRDVNAFIQDLTASANERPFVYTSGLRFNDTAGNGDGVIGPGEPIALQIDLSNNGPVAATGVSAVLSVSAGNISLLNATSTYPDIAPHGTSTNSTDFKFMLNGGVTACGTNLRFHLDVNYNNGLTYGYDFVLPSGQAQPVGRQTYSYTGGSVNIPDNDPAGITVTIPITSPYRLSDLNATFSVTQPSAADLVVTLISPNGLRVTLTDREGGTGANYSATTLDDQVATPIYYGTAPFSGSYQPETPLSALNAEPISGTWLLNVADLAAGNTGTLTAWSLDFQQATYGCSLPVLTGLSPNQASAGASAVNMTVTGGNFSNNAVVRWAGSDLTPTYFVTTHTLTVTVPAALLTTTGSYSVTVFNPGPTGGESNALPFTVTPGCAAPYTVTQVNDDGNCGSLSLALTKAAAASSPVTITFSPAITTLTISKPLPVLTNTLGYPVTLDGGCTLGSNGRGQPGLHLVAGAGAFSVALTLTDKITVSGLTVTGFQGYALSVTGNQNVIRCSWIGTSDGVTAGGGGGGIRLAGNNNQLGQPNQPASGNLISGNNGPGVLVSGRNNAAYYNWIGWQVNGTQPLANTGGPIRLTAGGQLKLYSGNRIHG